MGSFNLTNKAVEDLTNIWNYTFEEWSENQADTYYFLLLNLTTSTMFNKSLSNILLLFALTLSSCSAQKGWINLFNGKNLIVKT